MSEADPVQREMAAVASAILRQGTRIDCLSRCVTVASLVGTVSIAVLAGSSAILVTLLIGAAALTGLAELWFAGRVATDAHLFQRLSAEIDGPDWKVLDTALTDLGLMPAAKAGRPATPRISGAFRLLRYQAAALVVQFAFVLAGAATGATR